MLETIITNALDDLLGDLPARPVSRVTLEHVLRRVAQQAATDARNEALLSLCTGAQAAAELGVKPTTIYRWCKTLALGWTTGRDIILTPAEVETLRANVRPRQGRPRKAE